MSSHSFKLRKGLDLPISGAPDQAQITDHRPRTIAVLGRDFIGLKPRVLVKEGDVVAAGAPIFAHKDTPNVLITAPLSGRVKAINRGYRRALVSVEIDVDEAIAQTDFSTIGDSETAAGITEKLCASGLWTAFRARPFSKVAQPGTAPAAIFINAMDTEPLAADPVVAISAQAAAFEKGLATIAKLGAQKTYLCHAAGAAIAGKDLDGIESASFSGPHPAGLSGTHMHFLRPPSIDKEVWTIGYQDVIAIGRLVIDGLYKPARLISLAGPLASKPRLVRTVLGASLKELTDGEYDAGVPARIISGSVLNGAAVSDAADAFLGRYANQVTLIEEDQKQNVLGWIRPMAHKYALQPVLGSAFSGAKFPLTSNLNGGRRAMVPLGTFEELMPQDYLPTQLLRALLVMDTDAAQELGALELDEEDLSLATFACPAKI